MDSQESVSLEHDRTARRCMSARIARSWGPTQQPESIRIFVRKHSMRCSISRAHPLLDALAGFQQQVPQRRQFSRAELGEKLLLMGNDFEIDRLD